jgi:hypothetical protein
MATATKTKNGKVPEEMAQNAVEETKIWVDSVNKMMGNSKALFQAPLAMTENSFAMWQELNADYMRFVTSSTKQVMSQVLSFQKDMQAISEAARKQSQDMIAAEQAMAVEASQKFYGQAQDAGEQMNKIFTPAK